jgi:hypothetical protein
MQPKIHVIDEIWIDCAPGSVSAVVAEPANWLRWWPNLDLAVTRDRGVKGIQWMVTGRFRGTAEIWLEPFDSGVILHHYLRLDLAGARFTPRRSARAHRQLALHSKRVFWALKDELEERDR